LSAVRVFLALISYPALIMFISDGTGRRWVREHRSPFLPPDLREEKERKGRYFLFLKYALLITALFLLAGAHPWRTVQSASPSRPYSTLILLGVGGGLLLLICKSLLILGSPAFAAADRNHPTLKGSVFIWLAVFVVGGFAEELWQAVCISGLRQNDTSPILAALLTAVPFSVAHLGGSPPRVRGIGGGFSLGGEAVIGFVLGGIFLWSGSLLSLWIASLVYNTSDFYWLRRRYGQVPAGT
jgi:membrane protease YdiL (CAAX protease family)